MSKNIEELRIEIAERTQNQQVIDKRISELVIETGALISELSAMQLLSFNFQKIIDLKRELGDLEHEFDDGSES